MSSNKVVPSVLAAVMGSCFGVFVRGMEPCGVRLTASDAAHGDRFGWSISVKGNRAVIGAMLDDVPLFANVGSAYVFRLEDHGTPSDPSDDFWVQEAKLVAPDATGSDEFGASVSFDSSGTGDRVVVGASQVFSEGAGAAYVFRRRDPGTPQDPSDDVWVQEAKLTAAEGAAQDNFGVSVSLSGDYIVVGAGYDDDAGSNSGSAFVFRRDDNNTPLDPSDDFWVQQAQLTASEATAFDQFGNSVSISNDWIVVGAWGNDEQGPSAGAAYMFRRDDNGTPMDAADDVWLEEAKLTASDADGGDFFGSSVSLDGDFMIIGAQFDEGPGVAKAGSAYVFRRDDNGTPLDPSDDSWVQQAKLVAPDRTVGDQFGVSVSMSGDRAVVGAFARPIIGSARGWAYLFQRDDNGTPADPSDDLWVLQRKLTPSDATIRDDFGNAVAIDGDRVFVGAPEGNSAVPFSGEALVFSASDPLGEDCNANGAADTCDVGSGTSLDCNANRVPDECDVAEGLGFDCLTNRIISPCTAISLVPAGAGGPHIIEGNEITMEAGQTVSLEVRLSSWDPDGDASPLLSAWWATVDSAGFTSGTEGALTPFSPPCTTDADCQAAAHPLSECVQTATGRRCTPGFFDTSRVDYVFLNFDNFRSIDPDNLKLAATMAAGQLSPGVFDPRRSAYGATLLLEVPPDAKGTFTVGFLPTNTAMVDDEGAFIGPLNLGCARITIIEDPLLRVPKNRYLTVVAGEAGRNQAIRVTFTDLPAPFNVHNGLSLWVGQPFDISENGHLPGPDIPGFANFKAATLQCEPLFMDWSVIGGVVEVFHQDIVPQADYRIEVVDEDDPLVVVSRSTAVTARWGDLVGPFDAAGRFWSAPDGSVDIPTDVLAMLDTFRSVPGFARKVRVDVEPALPDGAVNITDVAFILDAFGGQRYPFPPGPVPCP